MTKRSAQAETEDAVVVWGERALAMTDPELAKFNADRLRAYERRAKAHAMICPDCGSELKFVPGKEVLEAAHDGDLFRVCSNDGCSYVCTVGDKRCACGAAYEGSAGRIRCPACFEKLAENVREALR